MSQLIPIAGPQIVQAPDGVDAVQSTLVSELLTAGLEPVLEGVGVDGADAAGTPAPAGQAYARLTLSDEASAGQIAQAASILESHA